MELNSRIFGLLIGSLWRNRSVFFAIVTPLALLPLLLYVQTTEAKAAYIIILMSVYWNFEVLPLGATALLPVLLVPLFGILPSHEICPAYFKDSNMLFLGGLIMAVSIEAWGLHKRIALRILILFGVEPRWLLLGFLLPTWILSMWISNTATTAMMLPIVEAVIKELEKHFIPPQECGAVNAAYSGSASDEETRSTSVDLTENSENLSSENSNEREQNAESIQEMKMLENRRRSEFSGICKTLMLSVAYGAVFGGVATIPGTSPNVIFNGIVQEYFGNKTPLNYSSWLFYALPISAVCLILSWLWLQVVFLGCSLFKKSKALKGHEEAIKTTIIQQYQDLGPLSFAEVEVLTIFVITIALWVSREPGAPGWTQIFQWPSRRTGKTIAYVSDAQPAILSAIILFFLPSRNPFSSCCDTCLSDREDTRPPASIRSEAVNDSGLHLEVCEERPSRLLTWRLMQEKVAWHIVLMLGSGLALAETSKESGLSDWIGQQLTSMAVIPVEGLVFIFCFCSSILTELTSNGASATILLPILASFSERIKVNPFFLMLPSTASCSFAFILPISTPANIMVYSRGYLSPLDMIRAGIVMTLISNVIVAAATLSYAPGIFGLRSYPSWAAANASNLL